MLNSEGGEEKEEQKFGHWKPLFFKKHINKSYTYRGGEFDGDLISQVSQ